MGASGRNFAVEVLGFYSNVELRRGTAGDAGDASFTGSDSAGMTP
jgi:hypothetical protein